MSISFHSNAARVAAAVLAALGLAWAAAAAAGPVNVNTADAQTLANELQGIGLAKAQAIIAHREKHGPFKTIDDVGRVKGIGRKTLERNRDAIRLDGRPVAPAASATAARARPAAPPARPAGTPPR